MPPDDSHVSKSLTELPDGVLEPEPPPWPPDDSHASKVPTQLPNNVVEPKPPPWLPDDEAFEAKPTTKPLDDPPGNFSTSTGRYTTNKGFVETK